MRRGSGRAQDILASRCIPSMDISFDSFAHRKDPCSKVFPFLNIWLAYRLIGISHAWAQEERISIKYPISKISFRYGQEHPALPGLDAIQMASVTLQRGRI